MTLKLIEAGFNYVADVDGSYTDADSLSTMKSETASNSVALTDDFGINASTSTVYADYNTSSTTGNTETYAALTSTIKEAEADGMSVIVRPLIDFTADASTATLTSPNGNVYADGNWRAYYVPTDTTAFFNSYDTMIVNEATAAQAGGAQIFDIGTELDQLTGSQYLSQWTKIINDVRAVFTGKLTYSAISDDDTSPWQYSPATIKPAAGTGNITTQVSFWSQLDYVGIDEYAALSNLDSDNGGADPTVAQLVHAWETPFTDDGNGTSTDATADQTGGLSLIQYYENISTTLGKPLLFTELGYNSAPDAASQPFYTSSNNRDPTLQANLYKAFFQAWQAQGNTSLQGVYIWNWEPDPSTVGAGSVPSWTPQGDSGSLTAVDAAYTQDTACYLEGTRIATVGGPIAIEALQPGMLVHTASGATRPIVWLGHRTFDPARHPRPQDVHPIRVAADAFAPGVPARTLYLSPEHAVLLDGTLVPIRTLLNDASVRQVVRKHVTYWHLELDAHDTVLAEGLAAESYLDCGNRNAFVEGPGPLSLHPDFSGTPAPSAIPRADRGPVVDAARTRLHARLPELGSIFETDPQVEVFAGDRLLPSHSVGDVLHVDIPPGCHSVRLMSRSGRPRGFDPRNDDSRLLGIAVHDIWIDGQPVSLHDARLQTGWHAIEPDRRWTGGDACLNTTGATALDLRFSQLDRYPASRESRAA